MYTIYLPSDFRTVSKVGRDLRFPFFASKAQSSLSSSDVETIVTNALMSDPLDQPLRGLLQIKDAFSLADEMSKSDKSDVTAIVQVEVELTKEELDARKIMMLVKDCDLQAYNVDLQSVRRVVSVHLSDGKTLEYNGVDLVHVNVRLVDSRSSGKALDDGLYEPLAR